MTKRGRPRHPDVLTPREWEVLSLIREGLTNEQIAERIGVTIHAARYHVSQILSKLGVGTREEAAAWEPEPERAGGRWLRTLQAGLALGAVCVLVGVGLLAWGVLGGSKGDARTAAPLPPTSVITMQLVAPDMGLVTTRDGLYALTLAPEPLATNILPEGLTLGDVNAVRFRDRDQGWLVAPEYYPHSENVVRLLLYRTEDGGHSWRTSRFTTDSFDERYVETANIAVFIGFLDDQVGWIVLNTREHSNDVGDGPLFLTTDGGDTWKELRVPLARPVQFLDRNNGWVTNDDPHRLTELYVTHDGGQSWLNALEPAVAEGYGIPHQDPGNFSLPVARESDGHLIMTHTEPSGEGDSIRIVESADRGHTWQASDPYFLAGHFGLLSELLPTGEIVGFTDDGDQRLYFAPTSPQPTLDEPALPRLWAIDFIDSLHGWALTEKYLCIGPVVFEPQDCYGARYIIQTNDGGKSWTSVTVPDVPTPRPGITPFELY